MTTKHLSLEDVAKRLEALEDHQAIVAIMHGYAYGFDYSRDADWLALFADDAVLEIRLGKGEPRKFEGIEALKSWTAGRPKYAGPPLKAKHLISAPFIHITGDEATAECGLAVLVSRPEGTAVASYARYEDHLVKCNGKWRIKRLIVHGES